MFGQRLGVVNWQSRIELPHDAAQSSKHRLRIALSARDESELRIEIAQRPVNHRLRLFTEGVVFAIGHDSDDFPERIVRPAVVITFANRILTREKAAGEGFVDNRDPRFLFVFVRQEIASTQSHPHRFEKIRTDRIGNRERQVGLTPDRLAFDVDRVRTVVQAERKHIGGRDGADTGNRFCAFHHPLKKGATFRVVVTLQANIKGKRDRILRIKPGPHPLCGLQAAHDQSCTDQQNKRKRDLRDNERVAQARAAKAGH